MLNRNWLLWCLFDLEEHLFELREFDLVSSGYFAIAILVDFFDQIRPDLFVRIATVAAAAQQTFELVGANPSVAVAIEELEATFDALLTK